MMNDPAAALPTPLGQVYHCEVKAYDIDARKEMTLPALVRHLQEAAMANVIRLKLSVWDLEPEQLSWVLLRKEIHLVKRPLLGEPLTVLTYPAGFDRLFTFRDFRIYNGAGELVATAATTWMLMHLETRRPTRYPAWITDKLAPQMPPPEVCLPRAASALPEPPDPDEWFPVRVGWHDLDFNFHLNNTYYLRWMLDGLPEDVFRQQSLRRLVIHYLREGNLGDQLEIGVVSGENGQFHHQLRQVATGLVLARMSTTWS
jgi:acyl-ACP thioesterase